MMNWILSFLKKFNEVLSKIHETSINLLHSATIPIVAGLSFASGYTTYQGMLSYVTLWWIALIITIAVQTIIVIASFELSKSYFRAHKIRFFGLLLSLLTGLIVSINFTYIMLYSNSSSPIDKTNKFEKMSNEIEGYFEKLDSVFLHTNNSILSMINELEIKVVKAEDGKLEELPTQYKISGRGKYTIKYENKLQKGQKEHEQFLKRIEGFRNYKKNFIDLWNPKIISNQSIYTTARDSFTRLVFLADNLQLDYGNQIIKEKPEILLWDDFVKTNFPASIKLNLSLFLALMIDFLALIFSTRLGILPSGELSEKQKIFIKDGIEEFSDIDINSHDQLQIGINMTQEERSWKYGDGRRYDDSRRKRALALLLSKGLLKRVDKKHVEFTQQLYDIVVEGENGQRDCLSEGENQALS